MFKKKKSHPRPYTVIRCNECGIDSQRPHIDGDYVYAGVKCPKCDHIGYICGIYGRRLEY